MLVPRNPLPFTVSVMAVAPAGTDVGEVEVTARATVGGGCVVPPFEAAGFEPPQPAIVVTTQRPTMAERREKGKQDFMIGSKYIWDWCKRCTLMDAFSANFWHVGGYLRTWLCSIGCCRVSVSQLMENRLHVALVT